MTPATVLRRARVAVAVADEEPHQEGDQRGHVHRGVEVVGQVGDGGVVDEPPGHVGLVADVEGPLDVVDGAAVGEALVEPRRAEGHHHAPEGVEGEDECGLPSDRADGGHPALVAARDDAHHDEGGGDRQCGLPSQPHGCSVPRPRAPPPRRAEGRSGAGSAPARRLVGVDAEAQLADELVGQHGVAGVEAAHADVAEELLEPVAPERAGAAGEVEGAVDDGEGLVDDERAASPPGATGQSAWSTPVAQSPQVRSSSASAAS